MITLLRTAVGSTLILLILALPDAHAGRSYPDPGLSATRGLPELASVRGKYRTLLRQIYCPEDLPTYKNFCDWGPWNGNQWRNHFNLPPGNWVYVYPHWYIWKEKVRD